MYIHNKYVYIHHIGIYTLYIYIQYLYINPTQFDISQHKPHNQCSELFTNHLSLVRSLCFLVKSPFVSITYPYKCPIFNPVQPTSSHRKPLFSPTWCNQLRKWAIIWNIPTYIWDYVGCIWIVNQGSCRLKNGIRKPFNHHFSAINIHNVGKTMPYTTQEWEW